VHLNAYDIDLSTPAGRRWRAGPAAARRAPCSHRL